MMETILKEWTPLLFGLEMRFTEKSPEGRSRLFLFNVEMKQRFVLDSGGGNGKRGPKD